MRVCVREAKGIHEFYSMACHGCDSGRIMAGSIPARQEAKKVELTSTIESQVSDQAAHGASDGDIDEVLCMLGQFSAQVNSLIGQLAARYDENVDGLNPASQTDASSI